MSVQDNSLEHLISVLHTYLNFLTTTRELNISFQANAI